MEITKKHQVITFVVWLLIVPPGFFITYNTFPSEVINWLNISFLFSLLLVTMLMPLQLQNETVSLERWITFTVFLQYGVFAELVVTQIALFILLFSGKSVLPIALRFFTNSIIFTIISVVSGGIFHGVGGTIGMQNFSGIVLFGLLYAVSYTLLNTILLTIYFNLMSRPSSFITKGAVWDFGTTMIVFPFSISLYLLDELFGNKAILLIGIPFLFVILIARMYLQSDNLSDKLSSASVIGHDLADRLGFQDVLETFLVKLKNVVPFDHAYVLDIREEHLLLLMGSENGKILKDVTGLKFNPKISSHNGLDRTTTKIFQTKKEIEVLKSFEFSHSIQSVMTAPIKRNQKTEGILILTSNRKNVFQGLEIKIVDMLTGYFAISLVKARLYEKTVEKSERCGLTKLHNYRYLDAKLEEEIVRFHTDEIGFLSTIILDIDHFKSINDTYGHQSGNDLLTGLATILKTYVGPDVTLARYGGEEFVIVLPDMEKDVAIDIAENLRREIELTTFRIIPDLSETREPVDVQMTISIGVATVPEDAGDAKELLRNADRALYIGGKQAGRNRVGVYGKEHIATFDYERC